MTCEKWLQENSIFHYVRNLYIAQDSGRWYFEI